LIPWYVVIICGLISAFVVVAIGGVGAVMRSRRNKDNRFIDGFACAVLALALMGLYSLLLAESGFLKMLVGALIASAGPSAFVFLRDTFG